MAAYISMWHYVHGSTAQGPVSQAEIQSAVQNGLIRGETLVWCEGMTDWQPASQTTLGSLFAPAALAPRATAPQFSAVAAHVSQPAKAKPQSSKANTVVMIGSGLAGFFVMQMLPGDLSLQIAAGLIAGGICGLLPLLLGKKKHPKLASIGFVTCIICGGVLGLLLALPVAIFFAIMIAVKAPVAEG